MKKFIQSRLETTKCGPFKFGSDPHPPPIICRPETFKVNFLPPLPVDTIKYLPLHLGPDPRPPPNIYRPELKKPDFTLPLPNESKNFGPPNFKPAPRPPPDIYRQEKTKLNCQPPASVVTTKYGPQNFGLDPGPPPNIYRVQKIIQPPLLLQPPPPPPPPPSPLPPGLNSWRRVGLADQLITFKSSHLKSMKKVIQSRLEITNNVPINCGPDPQPPPNIRRAEIAKSGFQPPLPLDPPPQDNLVSNIQVKQEIEDPEYIQNNSEYIQNNSEYIQNNQNAYQNLEAENHNKFQSTVGTPRQEILEDRRPICRDFNRGRCEQRPGTCRFAHRYEFCRQYQNAVCTFVKCKFVHANIFEEQEYYRSGYLPAHVFSNHVMQPPPPPPPEEPPVQMNFHFSYPPAPMQNVMDKPYIHSIPGTSKDSRIFIDNMGTQIPTSSTYVPTSSSSSSLKREWNQMEQFPAPPCDLVYNEQLAKKCKHCDIMEYRLQYNKNKVDQMIQSKEELSKKTALLEMKSEKLYSVILSLLTPTATAKMQTYPNAVNGNKENTLWEQLTNIFNANNRMSTLGQDK